MEMKTRIGVPKNLSDKEYIRFRTIENPVTGCWEWNGCTLTDGYGAARYNQRAHRLAYEAFNGSAEGKLVCHTCDNTICCNPEHLWVGTHADNMQDKVDKGRAYCGTDHHDCKLTEDDVRLIRASVESHRVTAKKFGVSVSLIYQIRRGDVWKHIN